MGDMKAKVSNEPLTPCTGKNSLHEMIIEKDCDTATSRDLVISSTMFPHKIFILKPGCPQMDLQLIK